MEEKKFLGGNLSKKITFGLTWLLQVLFDFGWILALVVFFVDKDKLDVEEKREMMSVVMLAALSFVCGLTIIGAVASIVFWVFALIACIKAFTGKSFKAPGAYHLAKLFIK